MNQINRKNAIKKLIESKISSLTIEDREAYILDWWSISEEDDEFSELSVELQNQILMTEDAPSDCDKRKYDDLIVIALSKEFKGVTNTYLSKELGKIGIKSYAVVGTIEELNTCPCCSYRTLESRGDYDICDLCDWEDDGVNNVDDYSGTNHMTLREARAKFVESTPSLKLDKWAK